MIWINVSKVVKIVIEINVEGKRSSREILKKRLLNRIE